MLRPLNPNLCVYRLCEMISKDDKVKEKSTVWQLWDVTMSCYNE